MSVRTRRRCRHTARKQRLPDYSLISISDTDRGAVYIPVDASTAVVIIPATCGQVYLLTAHRMGSVGHLSYTALTRDDALRRVRERVRSNGDRQLTDADAAWRTRPITRRQVRALSELDPETAGRAWDEGWTAGATSDEILRLWVRRVLDEQLPFEKVYA